MCVTVVGMPSRVVRYLCYGSTLCVALFFALVRTSAASVLVWLGLVCIGRGRIGAGCIFGLAIGVAFCALLVGILWTAATAVVVSPLFVALRLVLRCFSLVLL